MKTLFAELFPNGTTPGRIPKHGLNASVLRTAFAGEDIELLKDALALSLWWSAIYQDRAERFAKELQNADSAPRKDSP